jgi:phosphoserine phosphatase
MNHVLCLLAVPHGVLDPALIRSLASRFHATPRWLAEGAACELPLRTAAPVDCLATAQALAGDARIDVCLVPAARRRKRLLISDMDSTMITVECIDELADLVGAKSEVAAITRQAMNGELDFAAALRARVALLAGLPTSVFDEVYRERVRLMPGAPELLRTMRASGATTALVSGGFMPFAERVQRDLGFDVVAANRLEEADGRLTGRVEEPIAGAEVKLATLRRLTLELGLEPADSLAVGDGANDLPMLQAAGLGVAFRAHPTVAAAAAVSITYGDLSALLYLQGFARHEFRLD